MLHSREVQKEEAYSPTKFSPNFIMRMNWFYDFFSVLFYLAGFTLQYFIVSQVLEGIRTDFRSKLQCIAFSHLDDGCDLSLFIQCWKWKKAKHYQQTTVYLFTSVTFHVLSFFHSSDFKSWNENNKESFTKREKKMNNNCNSTFKSYS